MKMIFNTERSSVLQPLVMLLFLLCTESLLAQNMEISGTVVDDLGAPMPGVTVLVKGTGNGTSTDFDGKYTIQVAGENDILVFSYIGFETREVPVGTQTSVDMTMEPKTDQLDEIVVVGYGTQKKVNLTGSVATVNFDDELTSRSVTNISSALGGLAAGVNVMQGSGQPGSDNATIRIRGTGTLNNSDPLVLVDGFVSDMNNVNPSDIESISVLKDAAASAIYGSRAANGVILVTTRKGKGKPTFNYSGMLSFQEPLNTVNMVSDYARHMELINEGLENMQRPMQFSQGSIDAWRNAGQNPNELNEYGVPNYIAYPNTDWFDEVFNQGIMQKHDFSVSGSSDKVKYYLSMGYLNNEGIMENSGMERYQFRVNLESELNDWLTVGTRVFGLRQHKGMANVGRGFEFLDKTTPGIYPGTEDKWGVPALIVEESSNANNIFEKMARGGYDRMFRLNAAIYGIVKLADNLTLEPSFNYAPEWGDYATWGVQKGRWDYVQDIRQDKTDLGIQNIYNSSFKRAQYISDVLLRYSTQINEDHNLDLLAGNNIQYYNESSFNATAQGMADWSLHELGTATEVLNANGTQTDWALISYFGRVNYNFKQRYLFEFNIRADESSRFHPDSRLGVFPSFSAGYRISDEPFMESFSDVFQDIKIRGSWGQLGNNSVGNYAWQSVYGLVKQVIGGQPATGLAVTKIGNNYLEWESTTTTNIGLDLSTFGQRLNATVDLYNKDTDGILYVPDMHVTMGTATGSTQNLASVRNRGVEVNLGWRDHIGDFNYEVQGNFSANDNMVTRFRGPVERGWTEDGEYKSNVGETMQNGFGGVIAEGHTLGEYFLHTLYTGDGRYPGSGEAGMDQGPQDGMIRNGYNLKWVEQMVNQGYTFVGSNIVSPNGLYLGDLVYADNNGDGDYGNENDKQFTGKSSIPKYNFGLQLSASYRGWDMAMVWGGSAGFHLYWNQDFYNATRTVNGNPLSERIANDHFFYDTASPEDPRTNQDATFPRLTDATERTNDLSSTFWLYNASFVKLRNLQIGYRFPDKVLEQFDISKLRLYFSGENLLTITDYPGIDPEIGASVNYPTLRQMALGIQLQF
ncbi:SusC/RagA family TonB-linked outer membrane protein [Sinomicrobium soli]|uniref:SusC/RagA family TonB-linked outer membrane protein n=1 Tax=Sinomicrobium sp. N-1-3-6 TaxID=2219864 RepID=UPI000DCBBA76|nr:TonB-dependent receptor [Sinomicrobium sp. N-1-3-6]RAV28197.1 SusC/RagA family protein [Sinomicrobium sp. N-1-3-6]